MFGTIRKHQTWLWAFLITAIIVSFVVYFTPSVRLRDQAAGRQSAFGAMYGRPIGRREYMTASTEASLRFYLRYGTWPERGELRKFGMSIERETRDRLVILEQIRRLNVRVDDAAMAQWIVERFSDARQPTSAKANYEAFVSRELPRHGISEADFQDFVRHEMGIQHLVAVTGMPGRLLPPREAGEMYRVENEKVQAEAVIFSGSNYLAQVTVDPAALEQYYTNHQSTYRIAEKVQLDYVRFALSNFISEAEVQLLKNTNLAAEIDRAYIASGPNFFTDTNGQVMPEAAAKARLRERFRDDTARLLARKGAAAFATKLLAIQPVKPENLANLAAAEGVLCTNTEPFSEFDPPRSLRVRGNLGGMAFKLQPQEPFSSALVGEDGVYLLALKQRFPSQIPLLETIRGRLTEDFRRDRSVKLASEAATNFYARLTNAMSQGKSFADVCAEASVPTAALPQFSTSTRTLPDLDRRVDLNQLKTAVAGVPVGKTSALVTSRDGAFVAFVKSRLPVPDAELKQELPKYLAGLRRSERYEAFTEWFGKQLQLSRIDTIKGREEEPEE